MNRRKTKIKIEIDRASLTDAIFDLEKHRLKVQRDIDFIAKNLALLGLRVADAVYGSSFTQYDGPNDTKVTVEKTEKGYKVVAKGTAVLFLEFGSGAMFGYGHPYAQEYNMGPSTWSLGPDGMGHWDNPNGWLFVNRETGEIQHSFGNAPTKAMFQAEQEIIRNIKRAVEEVIG